MIDLILASQSPRRKQILESLGLKIRCVPVDIDESAKAHEQPIQYCERLSIEKAQAGFELSELNAPILGSDTIVVFENQLLGKPKDKNEAFQTLKRLSGNSHEVITSVSVLNSEKTLTLTSVSFVKFTQVSDSEINNHIDSGEPMDKAGSYGIQGLASIWIEQIKGSYSGIMGLPIYETAQILKKFNIRVL